jgi:hypothetical protein
MEWNVVAIDPRAPEHILAATNWNGILESHNGGYTWLLVSNLPGDRRGWRAIAFAPSDPLTVYAGSGGFFSAGTFDPSIPGNGISVSHNGGGTWQPVNDALIQDAHVTSLVVDPVVSKVVFAATINHGLVKSVDGGQSWIQVGGGLSASRAILSVAIRLDDPSMLYVGLDRGAVFKSVDGGLTWNRSSNGLNPEASVADIVFNPANPAEMYLADLQSGVYRSIPHYQRACHFIGWLASLCSQRGRRRLPSRPERRTSRARIVSDLLPDHHPCADRPPAAGCAYHCAYHYANRHTRSQTRHLRRRGHDTAGDDWVGLAPAAKIANHRVCWDESPTPVPTMRSRK